MPQRDTYRHHSLFVLWPSEKLLAKGSSNIVNWQANTFNDQIEAALYQNSELIWRIVQGSVYTGASQAFDDSYAKVIATQLAYSYMTNMIREINKALANSKASRETMQIVKATEELIVRLKSMTERANEMMMIAYTEAQSVAKMQQSVAQLFDHLAKARYTEIARSMKVFSN